jgi:hypothetical protein
MILSEITTNNVWFPSGPKLVTEFITRTQNDLFTPKGAHCSAKKLGETTLYEIQTYRTIENARGHRDKQSPPHYVSKVIFDKKENGPELHQMEKIYQLPEKIWNLKDYTDYKHSEDFERELKLDSIENHISLIERFREYGPSWVENFMENQE